jgi:hypothetical protein
MSSTIHVRVMQPQKVFAVSKRDGSARDAPFILTDPARHMRQSRGRAVVLLIPL